MLAESEVSLWSERTETEFISHNYQWSKTIKNIERNTRYTYWKKESFAEYFAKRDIVNQKQQSQVWPCGKCKFCPHVNKVIMQTESLISMVQWLFLLHNFIKKIRTSGQAEILPSVRRRYVIVKWSRLETRLNTHWSFRHVTKGI